MPTRSFVIETDGQKRFWDISWEGGEVEISSGAWGTSGRARQKTFTGPAERDAFIAAEIRKVEKKGYREMSGVAPVTDAPAAGLEARVTAWERRLASLVTRAWAPVFEGERGVGGTVRGPLTLLEDEPWPTCPACARPSASILELDCSRLPDAALVRPVLVQLVMCESWTLEEPQNAACIFDGCQVRLHERRGSPRRGASTGAGVGIAGWTAFDEAPPSLDPGLREQLDQEGEAVLSALAARWGADAEALDAWDLYQHWASHTGVAARNVHKLGGWPTFVQECPLRFSRQLFQLEQQAPVNANFGDLGAGHLVLMPNGDVRFFWAGH